jgi:phage tail P2-like protein
MSTSIDQFSLIDYLTPALKNDRFFYCLALALDPMLADIRAQRINNNILPRLQNQSTAVLDFLAHWHFDLDVYDDTLNYGTKLLLVQGAILNKIRKGTPSAVKFAMQTVFNYCELEEWWQTTPHGVPNTFKIKIADPLVDPVRVNAMIKTILAVKNARTYFAGIYSLATITTGTVYTGGVVAEFDYLILPYQATIR